MRTMVAIRDGLLRQAKRLALERHCTLSELVEESLRRMIASMSARPRSKPTRLPAFRGRGVLPGVDLDHTAALLDRMEGR